MNLEPINVGFGVDRAYVAHLFTTLNSMLISNVTRRTFNCWVVSAEDLSEEIGRLLDSLIPEFPHFKRVNMRFLRENHKFGNLPKESRLTTATCNRFILFTLPRELRRIIYCDSDLVFDSDIANLWEISLGGKEIVAVPDCGIFRLKYGILGSVLRSFNADGESTYFNSGVLVINLECKDPGNRYDQLLGIQQDCGDVLAIPDQDAMNLLFSSRWQKASVQWNYQTGFSLMSLPSRLELDVPSDELMQFATRGAVYHFTGDRKPWTSHYFPQARLYWEMLGPLSPKLGIPHVSRTPADFLHYWFTRLHFLVRRELLRVPMTRSLRFAKKRLLQKEARDRR